MSRNKQQPTSKVTRFFHGLWLVTASLLVSALLLEAGLYFLPVNEGLHTLAVNQTQPVLHFQPSRTATWSRFADFSMTNTVHANNFGFLNNQDYKPDAPAPLLAVIGDSYVEAAMVPYAETIHGRLANALQKTARVYSFGASGAPLSQYLAYAEYAQKIFHPQKMAFVIVGNDFDESLLCKTSSPGFHYFEETAQGTLQYVRKDFSPGWARAVAQKSRLLMYLLTNAQVQHIPSRLAALFRQRQTVQFAGQTNASAGTARMQSSRRVVDRFFDLLPEKSGLSCSDILFVVDGLRPQLYDPAALHEVEKSYFAQMRQYFMDRARKEEYLVADMQPIFRAAFTATGRRFEFPKDGHWNAAGHALAARAVLHSGLLNTLQN